MPTRPRLAALLLVLCATPLAGAQSTCATCDACTAALAAPDAEVRLEGDLARDGDAPCVVVRGARARLNGHGHTITAVGGVAVRVEGDGAGVRSLTAVGDAGVVVRARDVTVYNVTARARSVGVRVEASPGVRLERVRTAGGRVGVSFGASDDGSCAPGLVMRSPGAVVASAEVTGARVGIAACDARPVITASSVTRNDAGVVLGDPAPVAGDGGGAPWDPCVCAPGVEGLRPGTLAMFSSGCGGCTVHEGWMPSLRGRGADIRVRAPDAAHAEAQDRFDRYLWRCAPGVMDSLGIPGCVPNYACVNAALAAKRRGDGDALALDAPLASEDDVFELARRCAGAAEGRYARGARCVRAALADNAFCHNRAVDLRAVGGAARAGGLRNRCARAEGWSDDGRSGCTDGCDGAAPPAAFPDLASPTLAPTPPSVPPSVDRRDSGMVRPPAPAPPPTNDGPLWIAAAVTVLLGLGSWALARSAKA